MKNLAIPLTDEEMDRLDNFLLDRLDDDADTEGTDEGIIDISTLDGFFTAIVSGPVSVMPPQWLPAIWGDFEPVWETKEEFQEIFTLLIRHMNAISATLMGSPDDFEPIFMERQVKEQTYIIVDEWCEGYLLGVSLASEQWRKAGEEMVERLALIAAFTEITNWRAHELNDEEMELLQEAITPIAREIHAWWLQQRAESGQGSGPIPTRQAKVGRNAPCPCGSGKKYKKCCIKEAKIIPLH